jgi:hypothetical protein
MEPIGFDEARFLASPLGDFVTEGKSEKGYVDSRTTKEEGYEQHDRDEP